MSWLALPSGRCTLRNATVPACLLDQPGDLVRMDIGIDKGRLAEPGGADVDLAGAMVFPCFTDMHTHLDKGHIWPRAANPDGTFAGALTATRDDHAHWSVQDLRPRMEFSLRCAFAHGTRAIRTHLDSMNGQYQRSWPLFAELRAAWAGRIDLQAVSLISCQGFENGDEYQGIADMVEETGGVLGMVTYPIPELKSYLRGHFDAAGTRGLSLDFHSDETMDPASETLRLIAETVIETGFDAPVVAGHCCSLATQDEARALDTLDLVAKAGISLVSLPMCNLYLQDRGPGTPRGRGITLVHEARARGIPVAFASDNTRDPFYAYGDMDMLEVMREATRIGHLDHSRSDWPSAFICTPTDICGFAVQDIEPGHPADLVICKARTWTELFARPQADRIVLRAGQPIDRTLPDYSELDPLWSA